jgi:hypothetical protein
MTTDRTSYDAALPWPLNYQVRTYRVAALVMILVGVPTAIGGWSYHGPVWGVGILAAHIYIGLSIAFLFPWLQRRVRDQRTELAPPDRR